MPVFVTYVTISGFPVTTQDADGNYICTITYSDSTKFVAFCGQNIPDYFTVVTAASIFLGQNQNNAALLFSGIIGPSVVDSG